jgi:hypothetical protein
MTDFLVGGDAALVPLNPTTLLLGLLLSFLTGQAIAWVYMLTHSGLSYSRSFVSSLIVIPILVAAVMQVLANNLVTAFGMMAVFAIVRFRNVLRDTLDTSYVLASIVLGMACGTQKYTTALAGCLLVCAVMVYLWYTSFGSRHRYDLILNLHWGRSTQDLPYLLRVLNRHSRNTHCASQRSSEGSEGTDLSYRVLMRDADRLDEMLSEVRALTGVSRVTSIKAEDESEL